MLIGTQLSPRKGPLPTGAAVADQVQVVQVVQVQAQGADPVYRVLLARGARNPSLRLLVWMETNKRRERVQPPRRLPSRGNRRE